MQRIRIVSAVYPRPWRPESGRFAANLAEGWSARGIAVDVVTTSTLSERFKNAQRRLVNVGMPGVTVDLVRTLGTPFSRLLPSVIKRGLVAFDTRRVGVAMLKGTRPDLIYAQFAAAGRHARTAAAALGVPYVVDLGESNSLLADSPRAVKEHRYVLSDADGVVCVSPRLQEEAIELGADPDKVKLVPNYPNWDRFHPLDKSECRRKLGLDQDAFLVVYLGRFSNRKGVLRLNVALKQMKHPAKAAFLGSGDLEPDFDDIVHAGIVTHDDLPLWLCAADVMGLPTLAEGCCNAIAEAMACVLPIVTSDIEDVRWQTPEKGVILVDPTDSTQIAEALDRLAGDPALCAQMRKDLLAEMRKDFGKVRSDEVLDFMIEVVESASATKKTAKTH